MHLSAMKNAKLFFDTYTRHLSQGHIVEIGSQDVNGSIRTHAPKKLKYSGVDFVVGKGVDVIITDPYSLPFETNTVDIVVTSSCFEHSELFWVLFLEIMRVLKPTGLLYINVPSNGDFHRYPVDCWRFYPDSGNALVTWAKRNNIDAAMLESYIGKQDGASWNDFVAVFVKSSQHKNLYPKRILHTNKHFYNGIIDSEKVIQSFQSYPEDRYFTTFPAYISGYFHQIRKLIKSWIFPGSVKKQQVNVTE